ncbi:MAG: PRC-barrel domain-containing protein [Planctomycetaceae bacterium]|nr:PRC-barrel domain-containing protein [Planctomycetaceae bacterium]
MFTRTLLSFAGAVAVTLASFLPSVTQAVPVAHKFSDLKSIQVENDKGEKLGMIEDLVYDPATGQIRYAALEFGGFLGIGDKIFAVPWHALKSSFDSVNNRHRLVMQTDRKMLEKSPGFDRKHWPNFGDTQWSREVDEFYPDRVRAARDPNATNNRDANNAAATNAMVARASQLVGMNVRNDRGESLGSVDDAVIDLERGSIRYVAISYGGILGFGDKLFAVPYEALSAVRDQNSDKYHIVVRADKESLKQTPGFDKAHWPDFADTNWARDIDRHYRRDSSRRATATTTAFKSSSLIGMRVENDRHEDLGKIDDLVVDVKTGKIRYAAISFGGFLGLGNKLFAVPWQSLKVRYDSDSQENRVMTNLDKARLEKAPGFDTNHWPNFADADWSKSVHEYFGAKGHQDEAGFGPLAVRVSQIVGLPVRNEQREKLGTIDEVVLDLPGGEIRYAAMSFGGFLGIGDKLFAIPWRQVMIRSEANSNNYEAIVNANKQLLEKAPSFDKNNWPDFGDPNWSHDVDQYYRLAQ